MGRFVFYLFKWCRISNTSTYCLWNNLSRFCVPSWCPMA